MEEWVKICWTMLNTPPGICGEASLLSYIEQIK